MCLSVYLCFTVNIQHVIHQFWNRVGYQKETRLYLSDSYPSVGYQTLSQRQCTMDKFILVIRQKQVGIVIYASYSSCTNFFYVYN